MNFFNIVCFSMLIFNASQLKAQIVNIPDPNFKSYLLQDALINTNGDGEIQVAEASAYNWRVNCNGKWITDLTGIEAFTNLTILHCYNNPLTSLDLSQNVNLIELACSNNQLTTLNLSQNVNLVELVCADNQLTSLDVSFHVMLEKLVCSNNQLTTLDLSQNVSLKSLYLDDNYLVNLDLSQNTVLMILYTQRNQLTSLDLQQNISLVKAYCSFNLLASLDLHTSQNTSLIYLSCYGNQLTYLDLSQNIGLEIVDCFLNQLTTLGVGQKPNLKTLYCNANYIQSLDVSQCTSLEILICNENYIESLDVSSCVKLSYFKCNFNRLTSLDVKNGNNTIFYLNAVANPDLTCIRVDDSTFCANSYGFGDVDTSARFSEHCGIFDNITRIKQLDNVSVYPNPTTKEITLDLGKFYQEVNIAVTNLTGRMILNRSLQNSSITRLELEGVAGVYFVRIQTEEGIATLKIIKE